MSGSLRWRIIAVFGLVLLLAYVAGSNFIDEEKRIESGFIPDEGLRLGLDLRGGIHWVLGAKLDVTLEREIEHVRGNLEGLFEEENLTGVTLRGDGDQLEVELAESADAERVEEAISDTGVMRELSQQGNISRYGLTREWAKEVRERGMGQILEVLRRRIADPVQGIPDSVVTRQGDDRVLVQIPGGQIDRGRARELLRTTGFLEFKIVEDQAASEELLLAKYPDGVPEEKSVVFERDKETQRVTVAYLVPEQADITGEYLDDARTGFDNTQRPLVNFTFNFEGGKQFREITSKNVGKQLAIVLDDLVYSAPVVRTAIGARGQIEGRFTTEEARDLANILRSGSLPVPIVIEEERTVGPALGQVSIQRGLRASMIGLLGVVIFIMLYYRLSGFYASVALAANLIMVIGVMSLSHATLTLPGIAGLVLTVGMAVDANVIIFERIREELRLGKAVRAAIATGFSKALWTILDANITTLITAIVLFEFGTGPIKGFAVTLSIGIVTSVFAALVLTRLLFALYPGERLVEELSI